MATNLFIAYDLMSPGQNYNAVQEKIKSFGKWHQFQYSLFYVSSSLSAADAYTAIIGTMDKNDRLAVIEANSAIVTNWDKPPIDAINAVGFSR